MLTKKSMITYAALPLMLYASSPAQNIEDSFKQEHKRDGIEILEDKLTQGVENMEDAAMWVWQYIEKGAKWAVDKYIEESMERQVEQRLTISIDDPVLMQYLAGKGADFDLKAELIGINTDKTRAAFDVSADLIVDDAEFHQQYEFSLEGRDVKEVTRRGRMWVERYEKKITIAEFSEIAKLYMAVEDEHSLRDSVFGESMEGARLEFDYDPLAFAALRPFAQSEYNSNDNIVLFSDDLSRAQVGIRYTKKDFFDNEIDSVRHYQIDEYRTGEQGWEYTRTIARAMYSNDLLIGAGGNPFEKDKSKLTNFREKVEGFLDDMF